MRAVSYARAGLFALAALVRTPQGARADDGPLRLMHEPIPYTDVTDAFDRHDKFDVDVHLDYTRLRDRGEIYREATGADGVRRLERVGASHIDVNLLALGLDVGLWRDLMAFVRLPLVLRDSRALVAPSADASALLSEGGAPLFTLPFSAPTRAGLDYIALGGAWAPLNQSRHAWSPTWVLRLEGRRAIGNPLHACAQAALCGSRSSEDRDGDGELDGTRTGSQSAGASRGLSAVLLETRFSRRYRHVEPYAGLAFLLQWPSTARDTFQPEGQGRARPGPESTFTLGTALIPWEDKARHQRATLDLRLIATYVARGTDYSALFDALGTSSEPSLARSREGVPFTGLTEHEQYARYGTQIGVELQAARYVRFAAGTTLQWTSDHALSGRAACAGSAPGSRVGDEGSTCSGSFVDPRERGVIDAPGQRFFMRDQFLLGIYANATAMF